MSKYYQNTLKLGSEGDDVKEWQNFLRTQGYNVGVDGVFGDNTRYYTRRYQQKNGLNTDGVVGKYTWGQAGYSEYKPGEMPTYSYTPYDQTADGAAALANKNNAQNAVNNFQFSDYSKIGEYKELLEKYNTRDPYSFDINSDALYQQYADLYAKQGKLASEDTMAQAAALTGGYGNSYAQSVGQQQYQQYMNMLNEMGLEIEQNAYNRYQQEGQDMLTQIGLHQSEMDREHARDVEEYNRLVNEANTTSTDYSNGLSEYLTEHQYGTNIDQQNWQNYWTEENNKTAKQQADNETLALQQKELAAREEEVRNERANALKNWNDPDAIVSSLRKLGIPESFINEFLTLEEFEASSEKSKYDSYQQYVEFFYDYLIGY